MRRPGEAPAMNGAIDARTAVYGVIGYPIAHSLSPALHNAAFEALGLNCRYLAFPVEPGRLEAALDGAWALGVRGLNVTVPHKEGALAWAGARGATVSAVARAVGAANTLCFDGERIEVDNTDVHGVLQALLDAGFQPEGKRAAILGAGGSARAVVWALARAGARVTIVNRTPARAEALVGALRAAGAEDAGGTIASRPWSAAAEVIAEADLIVNTTPVGMAPDVEASPVSVAGLLRPEQFVYDLIYRPAETALLRAARHAGAAALNGFDMLVAQAARSFGLWRGCAPPVEVMALAARAELARPE